VRIGLSVKGFSLSILEEWEKYFRVLWSF
jgi:hypothetical protein